MKTFIFGKVTIKTGIRGIVISATTRIQCLSYKDLLLVDHGEYVVIFNGPHRETYFDYEKNTNEKVTEFLKEVESRMTDYMSFELERSSSSGLKS